MRRLGLWIAMVVTAVGLSLAGCGDDDDSSCTHSFQCSGSACACTTSGKEGTSCCDPEDSSCQSSNACTSVCRVCN